LPAVIRYLIADDLTGAADSSVAFCGLREVVVGIRFAAWEGEAGDELRVLDTETRHLSPADAAATVAVACRGLGPGVFKKVDSALRGPVAAELEAARSELGRSTVVVAPSLPAQGRTVAGGRLLVGGEDRGDVRQWLGPDAVPVDVDALRSEGLAPLVVIDAATEADLDAIARACAGRPSLLPAGSAGLAAAFARLEGPPAGAPALPRCDQVLVAVASRQPASRAQLEALLAASRPGVEVISTPAAANGDPIAVATRLAKEVVARLASVGGRSAVLATGGDAALAICRELGVAVIRPRVELLSGVVLSETAAGGPLLATKAGGFGGPSLLLEAALKLLQVGAVG
jgi:4-hydroxythreonine-4-phosphate dehydrogenase